MTITNIFLEAKASKVNSTPSLTYLSPPAAVSMADQWFEIATADHFWIHRRFEVLRRLADSLIIGAQEMAEIGCGCGLLQRQIEDSYEKEVTGFDLNDFALKQNRTRLSNICCYDVHQQDPSLRSRFDLLFLFDVLEHMADEDRFLQSLIFHLRPGGKMVVNVPAGMWLHSAYDVAAGHVRRYSIRSLEDSAARNDLQVTKWSYWGLPMVPALLLRKLWFMGKRDPIGQREKDQIISTGFSARSKALNRVLSLLSSCESIPQKFLGTSVMAVLEVDHA